MVPAKYKTIVLRNDGTIAKGDYQLQHLFLFVRMEQLASYWADFHEIWYFIFLENLSRKCSFHLKSDKNNGLLYMKTNIHFLYHILLSTS
jgi:hypothetical protein